MSRQYTDEELRQISRSLPDLALEALDRKNTPLLLQLLHQMDAAPATLHALGSATLARIWGKWHREHGEEKTVALLDRIGRRLAEVYAEQWLSGEHGRTISDLMALFKHQSGALISPISNSADSTAFQLSPCGSGGMMLLRGFEQKMPHWYRRLADDTPIFCRGCKGLQNGFNELVGAPVLSTEVSSEVTGACTMTFRHNSGAPPLDTRSLYALPRTRAQQAIDKVAAGNLKVRDLIVDQQYDWKPWHDTLMTWSEYTFAGCVELGGMDYLEDCLKECYDSAFGFIYQSMEAYPDDWARLVALSQNWHYHQGAFRLEEEDDRFVFILDPCGSGGRLFREEMHKDMFHYGTELAPIVEEPHDLTFGRSDFPLYCTHCASGNRDQFKGNPLVFVIDGHAQMKRGMPCRQYVWKKGAPRSIESRFLEQVGMESLIPVTDIS